MLAASLLATVLVATAIYPFAPLAVAWLAVTVPTTLSGLALWLSLDMRSRFALPLFAART